MVHKFDYSGNDDVDAKANRINYSPQKTFLVYKELVRFTEKIFNKGFTDLSAKPFNDVMAL